MTLTVTGSTSPIASVANTAVTPTVPNGNIGDVLAWVADWGFADATSEADRPTVTGGAADRSVHQGTVFGGGGTYGADTGPRGQSWWTATASSTLGADDAMTFRNFDETDTTGTLGVVAIRIDKDLAGALFAFTGGIDTSSGDSWAPSGYADVGAAAGDLLLYGIASVPSSTNPTVTLAWPGVTLGAQSNVITGDVTAGNDVRMNIKKVSATAGSSTGAPTTNSASTGMTGVASILRIRETAAVADAGADQTDKEPGSPVQLDASASPGASSFAWTQTAGPTTPLDDPTSATPSFIAPASLAGVTLTYQVSINGGAATDSVSITVQKSTLRKWNGTAWVPGYLRVAE